MKELEQKIGYSFINKTLLETALTHSSYTNERNLKRSYERLEFLGDSVLGMLTAEMLFNTHPELSEGALTKKRAKLVCEPSLANAANLLSLGKHLKLGKGEENTGGRQRPSILADSVEAILAAIYLDGGLEAARKFAVKCVYPAVKESIKDYKTILQEKAQVIGATVAYHMIGEYGPQHNKRFTAEILIDGKTKGTGTGTSKKEAEQFAARSALEKM